MTEPTPAVPAVETIPDPAAPEVTDPQPSGGTDPWADPDAARREIEKLRRENAGHRTKVRELEPLAQRARELDEAAKTEAERMNDRLAAAEQRATAAHTRAVRAEVKALAAATFADPDDAAGALDLTQFTASDGGIDTAAIRTELEALLQRKPHWAKDTGPRRPAPDSAQGSSGNRRPSTDPAQVFASWLKTEMARKS